jgi:Mg2+-importing ATPase
MVWFGLLSSVFDYITFGVLLLVLKAKEGQFQTGWFVESVTSACLVVLVIRTRRTFFQSRPGRYLLLATLVVVALTVVAPYTPVGGILGLEPLPALFLLAVAGIVAAYAVAAEVAKRLFYKGVQA